MSKDARRVVAHLNEYGISVSWDSMFDLEVCCSMFFVTHILGVIDKCLKSKRPATSLVKAQDSGWNYFSGPVRDLLASRQSAWQPVQQDEPPASNLEAYRIVVMSLLHHDINRAEANLLIYDIPNLGTKADILEAITICRDRNARTIAYLHGILVRKHAMRNAPLDERREQEIPVWEPGTVELVDMATAIRDWKAKQERIKSVRALGNVKTAGHRRRT